MDNIKQINPKDRIEKSELMKILDVCGDKVDELIKNPYFPSIPLGKKLYVVPRTAFLEWYTKPESIIWFKQQVTKKNATSSTSTKTETDSNRSVHN